MNKLIEDMLQAASIEAGMFRVDTSSVDVLPLVQDVIETLAPIASETSVQLDLDVPATLPAIRGDRERLLQVLSNLIGNAVKFVGKGGRVHVRAWREGDRIQVGISDNGPGIAAHDLALIFERYERGTSQGPLGVGLGLYIAKGIVEAHGGRIWVESQLGAGTAFFFTIPLS
jgi:signal transduction histidine kinase